jgi:8-oxo-dGTP pyrophosphatase MutT (NUDIX family)
MIIEIPAGMVDGSGNIHWVAIRELEEECGIVCKPENLIDLTELAYSNSIIFTWGGLFDEQISLFYLKITMIMKKLPYYMVKFVEKMQVNRSLSV